MRIAVLGARGQLGRDLSPQLTALGEVIPLTRADIDLQCMSQQIIVSAFAAIRPDIVVNCAAYNLVDDAEADTATPFAVNARGVHSLAIGCAEVGARFVHFSTDYVFGKETQRAIPYAEDDPTGPLSIYGASKEAGERYAQTACPNCLIIRTCGLYGVWGSGGKGRNFVETMLRLARQGKLLRVVNDQRCTPSYTADVARASVRLIAGGATGVVHAVNAGDCSWYEFAAEILRQAGVKHDLAPITSEVFGAAARRPAYSVLSTARLSSIVGTPLRPWQEALTAYLLERENKPG